MRKLWPLLLLVFVLVACESPLEPSNVDTDDDQDQRQVVIINIGGDHNHTNADDDKGDDGPENQPPVLLSPGDQENVVGDSVALQIIASDPDGDTLSWTATGLPRGLVISQTGLITGAPSPSSAIDSPFTAATVGVADGNRNTSGVVFTWVITDVSE